MRERTGKKGEIVIRIIAIVYFVIYLVGGLCLFDDYSMSVDEKVQREHSLIAYKYINKTVFGRDIVELAEMPELPEYEHKYYGTAIQMPMVLLEDAFDFSISTRTVLIIRHCYTFLICFTGYIFFYFFLKGVFGKSYLALLGTMFISLYPRFFAAQFYDIKNLIFLSLFMISIHALRKLVENPGFGPALWFGFITALATNVRIVGLVFPATVLGYFLVKDITHLVRREFEEIKLQYVLIAEVFFVAFWIGMTPAAWEAPLTIFTETFNTFADYENWDYVMLFMGKLVSAEERPWYYGFVWMGITLPIAYILLFVAGNIIGIRKIFKDRGEDSLWDSIFDRNKYVTLSLFLFWASLWFIIIKNVRIYIEWRHLYFLMIPFVCIMLFAIEGIVNSGRKPIVALILAVSLGALAYNGYWIGINHPYEYVYFNRIGVKYADQFDRDSWGLTDEELTQWILAHDDREKITIKNYYWSNNSFEAFWNEEERERLVYKKKPDYYLMNYRKQTGNDVEINNCTEVYSISVDGFKIGAVYKRNTK